MIVATLGGGLGCCVVACEYDGKRYPERKTMLRARRDHYIRLVNGGMNYTAAAHAVGVSKRTGKAWRNGRTRSTGRNEKPGVDCYRTGTEQPKIIDGRYLD